MRYKYIFPAALGELMHLKIKSGEKKIIFGIGDSKIVAYTHQLKVYLGSANFFTEIDFSFEQTTPLLGRDGFFNHFKTVSFNENEKFLELSS